nr:MAG TPA: hypothetical protein [Caudoviricetes sp.]
MFYFRYFHASMFHPHCSDRALGFTGFRCVLLRTFLYAETISVKILSLARYQLCQTCLLYISQI